MLRYISSVLIFLLFALSNNIVLAKEQEKGIKYIGEMNVQRAMHNSKKLDDGTILIFGGYNKMIEYTDGYKPASYHQEYSKEKNSEIYNPIDNTFKITDIKDLPQKTGVFDIIKKQERSIIEKYFEEKNISFEKIRYEKIDEENILCIPYNLAYPLSYGFYPVSEYFSHYNLKTKKISPLISFNNIKTEHLNFKPFKTKDGIKIFFIYEFALYGLYSSLSDRSIYCQTAIFNLKTNVFENISEPIKISHFYEHKLFQLENENIIVEEGNVFKYIYDVEKKELKPLRNYGFRMLKGANVLPLNNHQLLITGGYAKYSKEEMFSHVPKVKTFDGRNFFMLPERKISKSAYIYSF